MKRLLPVARLSRVTVYVHWSVFAISAVLVLAAVEHALSTLFLLACYLGLLLLHEWGHLVAAKRRGYAVWSIELYPVHGCTRTTAPRTHYDACLMAWGGVLAQFAVAVPLVSWTLVFGFPTIGVVNALLAIFGYLSIVIAVFNLLPAGRLDGAVAWQIIPYFLTFPRRPHGRVSGVRPRRSHRSRSAEGTGRPWLH